MTATHPADARETARQLLTRGESRLRDGDLEGARQILTQALALDRDLAPAHYALGNCFRRLRLAAEAEAAFKAALALDPGMRQAWFGLAFLYRENGRWDEAAEQLRAVSRHFAMDRDVLHQAGGLMGDFGEYADAAKLYEEMVEVEPQARNHLRLGQYYEKAGRYADAARALSKALELNPDAGAAYLLLASTRRFTGTAGDDALLQDFRAALARPGLSPMTQVCLHFALGKIHDDLARYDEAFAHFEQGNRLRRQGQSFDASWWQGFGRRIGELEPAALKAPAAPAPGGPAPLFVVGMLRSGTTLVERILASHPKVRGLGEVIWLDESVSRATQESGHPFPECLDSLDAAMCASLRNDYVRHWPDGGGDASFLVDKNPLNFTYLGFIARVFPDARIVHCRRDARDTCLSVYFQNFANPNNDYAYDLGDIGRYHNVYAEIMGHWRRLLPPGMLHEVSYEELVSDQERATRALLEDLGLPWDKRCLEFASQPDAISTASVWQARQPLYAGSVGRWRHYERHLQPLLATLKPA
ncbi:MAG TPA: sulfotransferase [Gammaproteobacteria bacterium]|jgi:tetratricopeptide (TPR) repeat protein|nr:sulfotransferase [Gammaproteobacteria bacterium]